MLNFSSFFKKCRTEGNIWSKPAIFVSVLISDICSSSADRLPCLVATFNRLSTDILSSINNRTVFSVLIFLRYFSLELRYQDLGLVSPQPNYCIPGSSITALAFLSHLHTLYCTTHVLTLSIKSSIRCDDASSSRH